MQTSVELVDGAWLTSFGNPRAMIEALRDEDNRRTAPSCETCHNFMQTKTAMQESGRPVSTEYPRTTGRAATYMSQGML
jgi:hypothetical protein